MVIFRFFDQNFPKLELSTFVNRPQNTYGTLRERYQVNFRKENEPFKTCLSF